MILGLAFLACNGLDFESMEWEEIKAINTEEWMIEEERWEIAGQADFRFHQVFYTSQDSWVDWLTRIDLKNPIPENDFAHYDAVVIYAESGGCLPQKWDFIEAYSMNKNRFVDVDIDTDPEEYTIDCTATTQLYGFLLQIQKLQEESDVELLIDRE